jgi:hypothetical protein
MSITFGNERIPGDDKARSDFKRIKRPPIFRQPIDTRNWTIDRSRNIFLVWTGGGTEDERHAVHFAFAWNGSIVRLKLEQDSVGQFSQHVTTTWRLKESLIPDELVPEKVAILAAIREAHVVYRAGDGVVVASHEARFDF